MTDTPPTPDLYDPADYNADEVIAYLRENPEQAAAILEAEKAEGGKDRKTVKEEAQAILDSADAPPQEPPVDPGGVTPTPADDATPVLPDGVTEARAATAQPTGDPSIDAPPYSDSANPPESRADYYATEVGSDQENLVAPGSGADVDPED